MTSTYIEPIKKVLTSRKTSSASKETNSSSKKSLKIDRNKLLNYSIDTLKDPPDLRRYMEYTPFLNPDEVFFPGSSYEKVIYLFRWSR